MSLIISSLSVIVIYTSFIFEMKNAYKRQFKKKDYLSSVVLSIFALAPLPIVLDSIYLVAKGNV